MKGKYLFFYLKTGGGHISTAKALERYFQKTYPDSIEVVMEDGFHESHHLARKIIVDGYATAQSHAKRAYEIIYRLNKMYPIAALNQLIVSRIIKNYIQKSIAKHKPTKIVVFHFLLVRPVSKALKALGLDIPVVTIVTDPFTGTRTWFMEKDMQYIVYSDRMKKYAISLEIPATNIQVFPAIIHEKFLEVVSAQRKQEIKKSHNIPQDKKVILLLGSGDGLPKGAEIIKQFAKLHIDAQVLIVCGRDKKLFNQVQKIAATNPHLALQAFEFIDFVQDLLNISDIVITKGGPATIFEILLTRKVPLIHTYMREQEKGNVEYLVENKVGVYEKNIQKLAEMTQEMLNGGLASYQHEIAKLDLKIGNQEIAESIKGI